MGKTTSSRPPSRQPTGGRPRRRPLGRIPTDASSELGVLGRVRTRACSRLGPPGRVRTGAHSRLGRASHRRKAVRSARRLPGRKRRDASTRGEVESPLQHLCHHEQHGSVVATHRSGSRPSIGMAFRSWLESNEGGETVSQGAPICPQPCGASVAVGEGMDTNPFAVGVGAESEYRIELGRVLGHLVGRNGLVQDPDSFHHRSFESFELIGHVVCESSSGMAHSDFIAV